MKEVKELIIVEGRYDKNAVAQAVRAAIIETSGFGIFSDADKLRLIKKLAQARGVILLTDGDKAGFFIRGRLRGMLGGLNVKQAYVPDIKGRERRKRAPSKEGKLGVEGMSREVIMDALIRAGATFIDEAGQTTHGPAITKSDLFEAGLTGAPDSAEARRILAKRLDLPERLSANALLEVLNILYTREEFMELGANSAGINAV